MLNVTRNLLTRAPIKPLAANYLSIRQKHYWQYEDGEVNAPALFPPRPRNKLTVGEWPATKEQRELAAKKYNMIPEDYEPHPEDEGLGDYPKFKPVGAFNRDKYGDYDELDEQRYYGEVLHVDHDLYMYERFDPLSSEKPQYLPPWYTRLAFGLFLPLLVVYLIVASNKAGFNHNPPFKLYHMGQLRHTYSFPESPNDGTAPHLPGHH